ncbi:cardiolipin synthase [Polycladidibacter hongkongensis]|uniref:cardiolipin synthase n=1 Tax=Polycladidibacter hongkongensis TaxID=1647556 RepID=UPI0008327011|nr:cardiolipin synthase [Pseudovibrio hongkongensis]
MFSSPVNIEVLATITLFLYALAIVCAAREIMYGRTSQGSIAWLLSLFFLPFPTVFLYFIFAWKRFEDYQRVERTVSYFEQAVLQRFTSFVDDTANAAWPVHNRITSLPFLRGNECELLQNGPATLDSILKGIAKAQRFILVQFFIIRHDETGERLANALIERATSGVEVFLLYDDIGSRQLSYAYIERLQEAGVRVSGFNKRHRWLRMLGPMRLNYRNHRKIVVTDGTTSWVGGHNIGDEYMGKSAVFGKWRDTHVRVSGPACAATSLSFVQDWFWATGNPPNITLPDTMPTPGQEPVLTMPTGPADKQEDCAIAFVETISRARERLWLVSPYFVPGIEILTALYAAALRGVDVRILLPEKADHWLVWLASYAHADDLARHGIKVYRYLEGFLHEKVVLVDDTLAGIGTVNMDNRSMAINFEITQWFTGTKMIASVSDMLRADFTNARPTNQQELADRAYGFRILARAARLFSPVL